MSFDRGFYETLAFYAIFSAPFYIFIGIPVTILFLIKLKKWYWRVIILFSPILYIIIYSKTLRMWYDYGY